MPLFASGRTFNPYASDLPAEKRRRLNEAEGVLTATGFPEIAGVLETAADIVDSAGDQIVPDSRSFNGSSLAKSSQLSRRVMGRRMRSGYRGRRKRRTTENSRTFRRVVRWKESKQIVLEPASLALTAGDGTTRTLRLFNPWQVLAQGDTSLTRDGDTIFCRGIKLQIFIADDATNTEDYDIVITYFSSTLAADTTTGGTILDDRGLTYGNTTTDITNPTQGTISGTMNVTFYNDSAEPFVGSDPASASNPDFVTVIKRWRFRQRSSGTAGAQPFKVINLWLPLNRIMTYENIEGAPGAGNFFNGGRQYYYSIAVVGASFVASTTLANMIKNTTLYWKEW